MHWISTLCAHVLRREKGEWRNGRVKRVGGEEMEKGEGEKGRWKRGREGGARRGR